jgi:hypothetical protein
MAYTRVVKFSVTGTYGCSPKGEDDVYTIEEFKQCCACKAFIDYNGWGYPVKDKMADENIIILPSKLEQIPVDATHIVWYNK